MIASNRTQVSRSKNCQATVVQEMTATKIVSRSLFFLMSVKLVMVVKKDKNGNKKIQYFGDSCGFDWAKLKKMGISG